MKKYIGFIILAGLLLSAPLARGEETNTSDRNSREERKELRDAFKLESEALKTEMEAKREAWKNELETFKDKLKAERSAFKEELKAKKDEFKKKKEEEKVNFCGKSLEMITGRFGGAIGQIERFQVKVEEILVKLNADGKSTTLATASLDSSKENLTEAELKLASVKALLPANCANMTPDIFEKVKLGAREAKDLLKESKENLRQVVKEIKALRGEKVDEEDENENN